MRILVAYASRYGSTAQIAERIAGRLTAAGHSAEARPVEAAGDLGGYDAFVVGGALYFGRWMKQATGFVRTNREALSARPGWIFSSGPLGNQRTGPDGQDLKTSAKPADSAELEAVLSRGHQVFFGALDPRKLGLRDRLIRALPAGRQLMPEGDFRDWTEIDAWADEIARGLAT